MNSASVYSILTLQGHYFYGAFYYLSFITNVLKYVFCSCRMFQKS